MEEKTNKLTPKGNNFKLIIFFALLGTSVAVAIWMVLAEIWPASVLIKLQAGWFDGNYYPKYTIAVVWICILLLCALIFSLIEGIIKKIRAK